MSKQSGIFFQIFVALSEYLNCIKGGFYFEGTDEFVISSNRRTLLFSCAWILKLWDFKLLKSCHKRAWSGSEGSNRLYFAIWAFRAASGIYLTWFEPLKYRTLKIQAQENNKVHLFEEMTKASVLSE